MNRFKLISKTVLTCKNHLFCFVLLASACTVNSQPNHFQQGVVTVGNTPVKIHIADTLQTRQRGLMHVKTLPPNEGMWFVFERTSIQCMWMKNTLIDLDVAFINQQLEIIHIEQMQANTETKHCSPKPITYALEMNLNWFEDNKIKVGDAVTKPVVIKD